MKLVATQQSRCRFGIALGDITPPVGIYHRMWGAATHDRAEGVHRPLRATAACFSSLTGDGLEASQVLLAVDHCIFGVGEIELVLSRATRQSRVPREAITLVCSHTHGAGLLTLDREGLPGGDLVRPYLERLGDTLGVLLEQAWATRRPATLVYRYGRCDLAGFRDCWDEASRQFVCGFDPDSPADDTLLVARATDDDGSVRATFVNYACHPTTLAWENRLISPDYPGAMRETIERATDAPCVFVQGASGDLGPREGYVGDASVADRNGRQLGYAALATCESLPRPGFRFEYAGPVVSGATLGAWHHVPMDAASVRASETWRMRRLRVPLRYRDDLPRLDAVRAERERLLAEEQAAAKAGDELRARDFHALVERQTRLLARLAALPAGATYPYELTVWRMGDAVWLTAQGEPYNALQTALRSRFAGRPVVVGTLAGAWGPSYLPPAQLYGRGIYQETVSVLAPGSLEALIEAAGNAVAEVLAD